MKKIYLLMIAVFISAGAFAQIVNESTINITPLVVPPRPHSTGGGGGSQLWLEYDSADAWSNNSPQTHFLIQSIMNKRYPAGMSHGATFTPMQYCIVRFDSLFDLFTNTATPNSQVTSITVDSIYAAVGHKYSSGTQDTVVAKILNLNAKHYPGKTVLWSDTIFTSTHLGLLNSYFIPTFVQWNPNYTNAMNSFAVELDFYGSFQDTFAIVSGFNNGGASGACAYTAIDTSNFYPNSFLAWTDYESAHALIPDTDGYDILLDCNGDHMFDTGDSYNYYQDVVIGAYITINSGAGIHEDLKNTGIGLYQNIPNPLHSITDIKYELANNSRDVTLSVYDIVGHQVMEVKEGNKTSGKYTIQLDASKLAKGMYTYTLRADGSQFTKRMIIE